MKFGGNAIEGTLLGDGQLQVIETPFGLISGVICWDTDYPQVMVQAGEQGVDILLSPAYVWDAYASIHFEMSAFRAIENGMTIVRQSDHGFSGTITPYGDVLTRVDNNTAIVYMDVPVDASVDTAFPQTGTVVGQTSLLGMLGLIIISIVMSFMCRRKPSSAEAQISVEPAKQAS